MLDEMGKEQMKHTDNSPRLGLQYPYHDSPAMVSQPPQIHQQECWGHGCWRKRPLYIYFSRPEDLFMVLAD